ncbi:hypothetical protein UPYG_G00229690 [Umbra pygmaea]|uniref:ERCC4 domain-containing protein n=1 Tax=Umbra pygmaea TaxID=75934 RepID=A0ABD0WD61_UMBPY
MSYFARTLQPLRQDVESFRVILANVTQLLSSSPPLLPFDLDSSDTGPPTFTTIKDSPHTHSPKSLNHPLPVPLDKPFDDVQHFQVNFSLEVDEDITDPASQNSDVHLNVRSPDIESHHEPPPRPLCPPSHTTVQPPMDCIERVCAVESPSWDEVFEDDVNDCKEITDDHVDEKVGDLREPFAAEHSRAILDESMVLFEDDEAFLEISIPDIPTPKNICIQTPSPRKPQENSLDSNDSVTQTKVVDPNRPSPVVQQEPASDIIGTFDCSQDFFSVNFDLGWEEEEDGDAESDHEPSPTAPKREESTPSSTAPASKNIGSPTPSSFHRKIISTPVAAGQRGKMATSMNSALFSPIPISGPRRALLSGPANISTTSFSELKWKRLEALQQIKTPKDHMGDPGNGSVHLGDPGNGSVHVEDPVNGSSHVSCSMSHKSILDLPHPGLVSSDSEEEDVARKRGHHQNKANPLSSPASVVLSDADSPLQVTRKSKHAVARISDDSEEELMSDNDFQSISNRQPRVPRHVDAVTQPCDRNAKHAMRQQQRGARHFLDEEAELSDEEGEVSSDEEDGEEQDESLEGFVVNNTQCSQGLNDSEMHGVYLKSVRSPAVIRNFKMVYKPNHNVDIFSQVPELDETYAEDSFVVDGSDEEEPGLEEEEEEVLLEPLCEESFVDGRRQYSTRRRALLRDMRAGTASDKRAAADPIPKPAVKNKRSRIVRLADSSSDEDVSDRSRGLEVDGVAAPCRPTKVQHQNNFVFKAPQDQALPNGTTRDSSISMVGPGAPSEASRASSVSSVVGPGAPNEASRASSVSSVVGPGAPSGASRASSVSSVVGPGAPSGASRASSVSSVVGPGAPNEASRASSASSVVGPRAPSEASRASSVSFMRGDKEKQVEERCHQRLLQQALLSDELDFDQSESLLSSSKHPQASLSSVAQGKSSVLQVAAQSEPPASSSGLVSVLVDSRCIMACADVVSCLRQRHAVSAHVCSLDGCDFVVSNRMAVERQSQSELAGMPNRKRLVERVSSLQSLYERVCLIIEKDRTKSGEASRPFQRTRYYDSTLASLVRGGVRLLLSGGPEESAALLAELARLEQRKGQAISVPLEIKGHRQHALLFYRTLPCVSYVHALNMCHNFKSVGQLINSSIEALQKGAFVSRLRAEEIYRSLRYSCDTTLMKTNTARINSL